MRWMWIAASAAGILLSGCGGGDSTTAETSPGTTTTTTTSTTVSPQLAIAQWGKDALAPSLDAIGSAFTWIGGAVKGMDFADARAGCRELDKNVKELDAKLPSPDSQLTLHLTDAVDAFREFSRDCQGLNPRTSEAELDEMSSYRERGMAEMNKAVDIVRAAQDAAS